MTADISRHSLRSAQRFTGVVRQQGRLPLDADETEAGDLATLMLRDTVAGVICARGTPDGGFKVSAPEVTAGVLDFDLGEGTFYLGGARVETDAITYASQPDWLTFPLDAPGPALPGAGSGRIDLVWLAAWEQVVTAAEDSELLERALGGPDTTARQRMVTRVQVLPDVSDDCTDALEELIERVFPGAELDAERGEVLSTAELTIGFTDLEPLEDLCRPSAQAGFLGARNETFRIQVTTPGRFVWSRDNAAPVYRVQVATDPGGLRRRLVFLMPPRDQLGWPLAGMTVELLRWGVRLPNGEKVAEPTGLFLRVDNGYDPATRSILVSDEVAPLANEVPLAWEQWFTTPAGLAARNPRDEASVSSYFFLRVWTGGGEEGAVDHAMDVANAVPLGDTGLTATFSASGLPGDYWIVSARPNTPTLVTPWALLDGARPTGPHRRIAPLALLHWNGPVPADVSDCRHRFRPLCRVGGCCLVTVGDGRTSFGDVESIQEAIELLPEEGGEVCIHPGEYREHVILANRRNVTLTGCGRGTHWIGEPGRGDALLQIENSSGIVVRRIAMTATAAESVRAVDDFATALDGGPRLVNLLLEDLELVASDAGAIAGIGGTGYVIRRCRIAIEPLSAGLNQDPAIGRAAAIFLTGSGLTIERCRIEALDDEDRLQLAAGGIHVGGGSEDVTIRDNEIVGGNGHGITLGSVQYVPLEDDGQQPPLVLSPQSYTTNLNAIRSDAFAGGINYYGLGYTVDARGCIQLPGTPPGQGDLPDDVPPLLPQSVGLVQRIVIQRNQISRMGYSGISAHVFAGLGGDSEDGFGDLIAVESIEIESNVIADCMRNEIGAMSPILRLFVGWGGIALSICADATIRDNVIRDCGTGHNQPICGVFIAIAEDVKLERNRIEGNGREPAAQAALLPGRAGGIVIGLAIGGVSTYGETGDVRRSVDRPALLVAGNVVDSPAARALRAITLGPCIVLGNRLTGAGRSALFSNPFGSLLALGLSLTRIGSQIFSPKAEIDLFDFVLLELLSDVLGGDVVNLISLCVAEDVATAPTRSLTESTDQRLRGGELLVNDNQISLRRHSSELRGSLSAVLLLGADDVSFCDNQAEVENDVQFVLADVLAIAATLRCSSNRMQKRINAGILSAITFATLNQTSLNQTTHCILAVGPLQALVVRDNRALFDLYFQQICALIERAGRTISERFSKRMGLQTGVEAQPLPPPGGNQ